MEQRLIDVLTNKQENYIAPFLWLHGEDESTLRQEMEKIDQSGIGAVCVESRPHPDFLGEKWWADLDVIMDEARKRNMRVWVLDDAHFPSGYANGAVKQHPEVAKRYVTKYSTDIIGPMKQASLMIDLKPGEQLLGVVAGLRDRQQPFLLHDPIDITDRVKNDLLYWDVPPGLWCLVVIKTTSVGIGRKDYINPIDQASVKLFLNTVYEPHYQRYQADFGQTFAGFFSDEPELGNAAGGKYGHRATIGLNDLPLSWSGALEHDLKEIWDDQFSLKLAGLWHDFVWSESEGSPPKTPLIRYDYMDQATRLYDQCFGSQIGDWCRARGVEYIGHVIEDGNCHSATGLGTGHFFRALKGQDMSGIDVVLQQIRPGLDDSEFFRIGGNGLYHGRFFHYGLAKLGVSLGHLDPKKQGRTMCEIFGAYGWSEGLKLMKWLADHMLVRGVNYWIPHAFSPKQFPDPDCPPHFYASGMNPQFPYFKYLMDYMNRVSHLICGGSHIPNVAVLYDGEADWSGDYVPLENVGEILAKNQIDYEIMPAEILTKLRVVNSVLVAGKEQYQALVICQSQYLPESVIDWCAEAQELGFPVFVLNDIPLGVASGHKLSASVVNDESLVGKLRERGAYEIELTRPSPGLRYYHYQQEKADIFLFFNESSTEIVDTKVRLGGFNKQIYCYNAFMNKIHPLAVTSSQVKLELVPGESTIFIVGQVKNALLSKCLPMGETTLTLQNWRLECIPVDSSEPVFAGPIDTLDNVTAPDKYPYFTGSMEYKTEFTLSAQPSSAFINLGAVYETAEVWINNQYVGVCLAPPYELDISRWVQAGKNTVQVKVVNHLGHRQRDLFSRSLPLEPSGLLGPVVILI